MAISNETPLVTTIRERCRVCFTCVRECPAKAIRIVEGQAEVIPNRCIGCGNCVRVCSQQAKRTLSAVEAVNDLLAGPDPVAALIAPSFAAEFGEDDYPIVLGAVKRLGFMALHEVAFGAELVALGYRKLLASDDDRHWISTACPAIVTYIEKYHPELVPNLAPIVSPMVAMARVLKQIHGPKIKIVFVGPCIAKKSEAMDNREVDQVLTFRELRLMLLQHGLSFDPHRTADFDAPQAGTGSLFPLTGGLLDTAKLEENLLNTDYVSADGRANFVKAIEEFEAGTLRAKLLDLLCCTGCIMGAGMSTQASAFLHRARVSRFTAQRLKTMDRERWLSDLATYSTIDLHQEFTPLDQRAAKPSPEEVDKVLAQMGKYGPADELNCGACGYDTCRDHAEAIIRGLAERRMCLPYTIDQQIQMVKELHESHKQLESAQEALMHSEKLASMGQLAAGIAHEVNNPLGVVLMYAHLLLDESPADSTQRGDLKVIAEQAERCKRIVQGLLDFARQNQVVRLPTDIRKVIEVGLRSVPAVDNVTIKLDYDIADPIAEIDHDQVVQIVTNLVSNAYTAMAAGGVLTISARGNEAQISFAVADQGCGIPKEHMKKIFTPFFTTKQLGKGTGLGLPVVHGIVKMHRGDIQVVSNADPAQGPTGTTFTVTLPRRGV